MAHLRPQRRLAGRVLIALTLACSLTGGASATAGLRPDPRPQPVQPRPEAPPQTRVSPQPQPAPPPPVQPAPVQPPPAPRAAPQPAPPVVARTAPVGATDSSSERSPARTRSERATGGGTAARGTSRAIVRDVAPAAFTDPQSNVGTVLLLSMVALAAALLLFGFGVTPARVARWPAAARALEQQGDVLVVTGLAILAASGAFLLLLLITPS